MEVWGKGWEREEQGNGAHSPASLTTSQPLTFLQRVSTGSAPAPHSTGKCQCCPLQQGQEVQGQEVQPLYPWDSLVLRGGSECAWSWLLRLPVALEEVLEVESEDSGCRFSKG